MLADIRRLEAGKIASREQLLQLQGVGPVVAANCAGFVRIAPVDEEDVEGERNVLDGTRVHPEAYHLAGKIATDAM